jgi:proline iminopeptidase
MPYAVTTDNVRLYFEEAGQRNADYLPARIRGRLHQLGAADALLLARPPLHCLFRARLYALGCAASADVYTYKHFYTDALAYSITSKFRKAHFVGLSMGSYSSLQIGPERAGTCIVADAGGPSAQVQAWKISMPSANQFRDNAEQYETIGAAEGGESDARGAEPDSVSVEGPARPLSDFYDALAPATMPRAPPTPCAAFRPAGPRSTP